jgi:hypothetical protein
MAGVESLKEFKHFTSAAFPQNNSIRAHSEGLPEKASETDFAITICIGGATGQSYEMRVGWQEFRGIFKGYYSFGNRNF